MTVSAVASSGEEIILPSLREDLRIQEGIRDIDGHRTWTLYDPVRNRYFQLTERDFNLLACWGLRVLSAVKDAAEKRGFPVDGPYINEFASFLMASELVIAHQGIRARLFRLGQMRDVGLFQSLLHLYLSFRIPLIHPDKLLNWLYPRIRFLFTRMFLAISLLCGFLGIFLIAHQWDAFIGSFSWFFNPGNMVVFFGCLAAVKVVHEFGHGLMCRHFGVRVPSMGVAFLVMWPVLYTDASDAWRLQSRHQRALISFAGVLTETVLVCYAMLAWIFVPDGIVRSMLFSVITTVWITSIAVNLNPVMRFDGYYFFSDILNIPNLQDRSFLLGKWKLRQWLFGSEAPAPEAVRADVMKIMVSYAFFVWIYRFSLFIGIAVLVYHFFFKALGIFLFGVEMWWFIMRPIFNETAHWGGFWRVMADARKKGFRLLAVLVFFVLVFPWRSDMRLPAQIMSGQVQRVFPVRDAQIDQVLVVDGQKVSAGQPLVAMHSPELDQQIRLSRIEVDMLQGRMSRNSSAGNTDERLVLEQDLGRASSELAALLQEQDRMQLKAAFSGVVRDLDPALYAGRWISRENRLMTLVGAGRARVIAWVDEGDVPALPEAAEALFYPERPVGPSAVKLRLSSVESAAVYVLDTPYQASVYGGQLPVGPDREGRLVPEVAFYRMELAVTDGAQPEQVTRGWVTIEGRRRTLVGRLVRLVAGTIIRESGF